MAGLSEPFEIVIVNVFRAFAPKRSITAVFAAGHRRTRRPVTAVVVTASLVLLSSSLFLALFLQSLKPMAGRAAQNVAKTVTGFQYPWREKLEKYGSELSKGVWGYWELGTWKPLGISARRRAMLRKEVLLAGEDWTFDPERKEMTNKRKGHKCDRIAAEKRENTMKLMEKMPKMVLDYKKRRWEKKMKEEEKAKEDK